MLTITANIPANKRTWKNSLGKMQTTGTDAYEAVFGQDADGRWSREVEGLGTVPMLEEEVIDMCQKATNWQSIKALHFAMVGFAS